MRAANQQRDSATVNINVLTRAWASQQPKWKLVSGTAGGADSKYELHNGGVGFINVYEVLRKSDFFNCYAPMYDQFKIDMIRVKITPSAMPAKPASNRYINDRSTYTVITAWDRTGFSEDQFVKLYKNEADTTTDKAYYLLMPPEVACTTYSSARTKNINSGSSFNIVRYLYPSDQQEKGQYISTKKLEVGYVPHYEQCADNNNNSMAGISCPYYTGVEEDIGTNVDVSRLYKENPCNPVECVSVPFKPTLLIGILSDEGLEASGVSSGPTAGNVTGCIAKMSVNLEFDISVTFRGLRKTQIV